MESIDVVVDDSGPSYFSNDEDKFSLAPIVSQQVEQEENKTEKQKKEPEDPTPPIQEIVVLDTDSESEVELSRSKLNTSQSNQVHPRSQKGQVIKNRPLNKVIGDVHALLKTRSKYKMR